MRRSLGWLLFAIAFVSPSVVLADQNADNCFFDWAEKSYPQFFSPAGAKSAGYQQYYYRYYSGTGNYLATSSTDNRVYVVGPQSGNQLTDVGTIISWLAIAGCQTTTAAGIASQYKGDVNIQSNPDVLFTEMGEETTLPELFARWDNNSTANSVALDTTTSPANSPGRQSIRLFTTATTRGVAESAVLYKYFPNSAERTIHARWYVKYNSVGTLHHSGPRLGGSNPPSATSPGSRAGVRPTGADFFYLGAEPSQGKAAPTQRSTFDFYNYWMHQRGSSFFPGSYFGNTFINSSNVAINTNEWNCIEVQLTLNDPITGFGGEIAMWINGVEVSRVKQGTTGTWTDDKFQPSASGQPFEGFQWRNTQDLKWNYFQLLHFVDNDPAGLVNSVNYDHIVIARKYIGPIH